MDGPVCDGCGEGPGDRRTSTCHVYHAAHLDAEAECERGTVDSCRHCLEARRSRTRSRGVVIGKKSTKHKVDA